MWTRHTRTVLHSGRAQGLDVLRGGVFLLPVIAALCSGCSSQPKQSGTETAGRELISPHIQQKVQDVASSVVGIAVASDYTVEVFEHELHSGRPVQDPSSPTGYRLRPGQSGITVTNKSQEVYGGGLIISQDDRSALIMTSHHVLVSPDTLNSFWRDSAGNATDLLFSRTVKTRTVREILGTSGRRFPAEVVRTDSITDLGLLSTASEVGLGLIFPFSVAYDARVGWGDLVFAFGYPRGVKQLSFGVTSLSPYPGTFALDAAARFGFSGGPVFVVKPEGELQLAGVIRGAQVNRLQFISPPPDLLPGQALTENDLKEIKAEEYTMIEYGISFAIDAQSIGSFLTRSVPMLEAKGIQVPGKFLPKR